ncbi:MAG: hypothetical protein RR636_11130 [Clostridium sp.]|uniref:hypothetical protein n=1 Tax=Clostridium sp. TaxID=1506 RepID=UPI0032163519
MSDVGSQSSSNSNSWNKPMGNITWGFIFTVTTLNFYNLDYILPTIGVALLFIGFYDLRKINKELHTAWIFSIISLVMNILSLIYTVTPLHIKFSNSSAMIFISTVFQITFFIVFRTGLNKVFQEANIKPNKDPIFWLVIWRIVIVICALTQLGSVWFIFIPLIYFYFYNFTSLYRLSEQLEQINFMCSEGDIRVRSKKCFAGYLAVCVLIFTLCSGISNHIKLKPVGFIPTSDAEVGKKLIDMGFPEEILKDITEDEISLIKDAIKVEAYSELLMFDPKQEMIKTNNGVHTIVTNKEKPGRINLRATSIYVLLKDNRMYGIKYFYWQDGSAYWNDGFTISGSAPVEVIAGNLLYEKDGINYSADIPRLKCDIVSETGWLESGCRREKITGAVNYPFGSKDQRGYVFYELELGKDVVHGGIVFNYIHHRNPFIAPYEETEMKNLFFSDIQRQLYTNFERRLSNEDK